MNENSNFVPKRKKTVRARNEQQGKGGKIRHRTDYMIGLFGDYSAADLKFSQKLPVKLQIIKLKELLKTEELEDGTMGNFIQNADSLYVDDVIKTDVYSSSIQDFDSMFTAKGITSGEIIELCGPPQSGKTLLIHTFLINVFKDNREIEAIYFDSQTNFNVQRLTELLKTHGFNPQESSRITSRVAFIQINNMFELLHALQELFDPRKICQVYKKDFDMSRVRFIIINTITLPFYHISSPVSVSKKITSDLHKMIHRLSKYYGIVFFITNLALNKYKISESDKGDDVSSVGSVKSNKDMVNVEDVKAALDEFWPEILDHRFVITSINSKCDILGHVEIPRQINLVESRNEKVGKSITVKITELGLV